MAKTDNQEVNIEPCSSCEKIEYLFDNLFHNSQILERTCEKLRNENKQLKKEKEYLEKLLKTFQSKDVLDKEEEKTKEENSILKKNVHQLKNDITNFVKSTETFQNIIGAQKNAFDKTCIGFKEQKHKLYKNLFIPEKLKKVEKYKCTYCEKYGHIEPFCFKKKKEQALHKTKVSFKSNYVKFHKKRSSYKKH